MPTLGDVPAHAETSLVMEFGPDGQPLTVSFYGPLLDVPMTGADPAVVAFIQAKHTAAGPLPTSAVQGTAVDYGPPAITEGTFTVPHAGHDFKTGDQIVIDGHLFQVTDVGPNYFTYGPVTHAPVIEDYYTLTDKELHYIGPPNGPMFTMAELLEFISKETVKQTQQALVPHG